MTREQVIEVEQGLGRLLGRFGHKGELRIDERRGRPRKVADLMPYTGGIGGPIWQQSGRL